MEDRMNAGLLLVLFDEYSDNDIAERDAEFRKLAGVSRVSWWKNVWPDRDDWIGDWRRIKNDFKALAVCEVDGPVDQVQRPSGHRTILMRRGARPSQGVLRLPIEALCVVLVSPTDLDDAEGSQSLRDWGDFVHFPGIVDANIPGYGLVTPYENVEQDAPRFLHLYELSDPDAEAVFQRTRACVAQRFGSRPGTPAFDHWERHPLLELDYLGNFTRIASVGEAEQAKEGASA